MTRRAVGSFGFVVLMLGAVQGASVVVTRNEAVVEYPQEIRFLLSASSSATVESVELEFGTDALSCGESTTRAFPEDFTPSLSVDAEWSWDLRRTGALPPGTVVWWRWTIRDASGAVEITREKRLTFADEQVSWQSDSADGLRLYWLEGSPSFAASLLEAGTQALIDLEDMTGVTVSGPIQAYIYASSQDMQSATLFAPDWSGGLAFPRHRTVLLGVSPDSLGWGRRALAHELAHVVIGYYTFSCVDSTPTWLSEGLAMEAEGELESYYASVLEQAVAQDTLLSVRSLGEIFSGDPDLADRAYAQSQSLVQYLIETYGRDSMLQVLEAFREGAPEDQALQSVFGLNRDGLEAAWRAWIGAQPMSTPASVGAAPTRTPYPTFAPITGPVAAVTETPKVPTPIPEPEGQPPGSSAARVGIRGGLLVGLGCIVVLLVGGLSVWLLRRGRRGKPTV